jgi:hypothetical protein
MPGEPARVIAARLNGVRRVTIGVSSILNTPIVTQRRPEEPRRRRMRWKSIDRRDRRTQLVNPGTDAGVLLSSRESSERKILACTRRVGVPSLARGKHGEDVPRPVDIQTSDDLCQNVRKREGGTRSIHLR